MMYWDYKNFDQDIFNQEICTGLSSETVLDYTRFEGRKFLRGME